MKVLKKIIWSLLILFLLMQFIRPVKNKNSFPAEAKAGIHQLYPISDTVQAILKAACYDCHSNNSAYPWYAEIQPLGWSINKHIVNGKAELNFDEFGTYSKKKRKTKLMAIASQIQDDEMPLNSYRWLHSDANLSNAEKQMLINWTAATIEFIELNSDEK